MTSEYEHNRQFIGTTDNYTAAQVRQEGDVRSVAVKKRSAPID